MNSFKANWSGKFPNLCKGIWSLYKNKQNISAYIPKELINKSMGTYGIYQQWYFNKDMVEEFHNIKNGYSSNEWVEKNKYWLSDFCENPEDYISTYKAFQKEDFRINSCGGCI